jgi:hypothetical protein
VEIVLLSFSWTFLHLFRVFAVNKINYDFSTACHAA